MEGVKKTMRKDTKLRESKLRVKKSHDHLSDLQRVLESIYLLFVGLTMIEY